MDEQPTQFEHVFRYKNRTVRLICSLDTQNNARRLVLEEVYARTQRTANSVPDWRIESEACKAAFDHHATYM